MAGGGAEAGEVLGWYWHVDTSWSLDISSRRSSGHLGACHRGQVVFADTGLKTRHAGLGRGLARAHVRPATDGSSGDGGQFWPVQEEH